MSKEEILKKWKESGVLNDLKHTDKDFQMFKTNENQVVINDLDEETKLFYNKLMFVIDEHKRTGEDYGVIIKKHKLK